MTAELQRPEIVDVAATSGRLAPALSAQPGVLKPVPAAPLEPVLLFERVSKWYGPVIGVNQVSLDLRRGITGLVGANGAGKSTLLRLAAGHIRPDLGRVTIRGHDSWAAAAKLDVGYCPEVDRFYEDMSGRRFVRTMARLNGFSAGAAARRTEQALELVGMADRADRALRGYSKGMRQRIKLAQALIHDPALLLLDEPLSGIDPLGRRDLVDLFLKLADLGKCLLISSHELEELEKLTDHIAIVARGRIAAVGTLTQIRDLLDDHPLSVRLDCDQNRKLAGLLLGMEEVVGVDADDQGLIIRVRSGTEFFRRLTGLILEEDFDVRHLEALDDSTHSILEYLLK